ncbi:tRNA pseudouridine(55) synthase TruB [Waddlia chondrophila]|uniref:tRNA pseudouridine synthase B n=2 Tax=Waddlia chondrophila TaxID=71667 RepID=D6YVR1_WADCW|nr:tRNA pseudouridine(55) synthase TruB [Waddlia chondrophila]ADI38222.1 tRNA pseudouridine synthase B [Waddlia chondrophila WSU 86-1044]
MKSKTQESLLKLQTTPSSEGILPINKPVGITAFTLVRKLRRLLGVKKIGHAGTLDPFATGVMVMLIGRNYTKFSDHLMGQEKEYVGRVHLGIVTDTYDSDGVKLQTHSLIPSIEEISSALSHFQGVIEQIPPMYSAKKINGQKLYKLARQGEVIERKPVKLHVQTDLIAYEYPYLDIRVTCSKGTYIRSIAHDLGQSLGCGAHLATLTRTRSGSLTLADCFDGKQLDAPDLDVNELCSKILNHDRYLSKNRRF